MAEWIKHSERVTHVRHMRVFDYAGGRDWGFAFDCDEQGNLSSDPMNLAARDNYAKCLTGTVDGRRVVDRGIQREEWTSRELGVIRCACGAELELYMVMTNTCDECGRDYNSSGQLLAPREQWGWDTGESLSDILMSDQRVDGEDRAYDSMEEYG
jgi:hypothetical protein